MSSNSSVLSFLSLSHFWAVCLAQGYHITLLRTGEGSQKCSGFCPSNKDNKYLPTFFIELIATFLQSEVRCRLMYHSISYFARPKSLHFRFKLFRLSSLIGERGLSAGRNFPFNLQFY